MIFNSVTYILFLVFITTIYWVLNTRGRLYLIFFASLTFYGFWKVEFLSLILISSINDYWMSILIYDANSKKYKKIFL